MLKKFTVRLQKEQHIFTAAHFITYDGNVCEPIHGHNYRVWVEVVGPLDENHYVIDFVALGDRLTQIVKTLDHHVLLPTGHPSIKVEPSDGEVHVRFADRRWVFPLDECALLPIPNTTAELLAQHIGNLLTDFVADHRSAKPTTLRVAVDENNGQWGICQFDLPA